MKKLGNSFIIVGVIGWLLLLFSPLLLASFPSLNLQSIRSILSFSELLIIIGIVIRIYASRSSSELINPENVTLARSYVTWRNVNIAGIILWFPMWFSTIMLLGGTGLTISVLFTILFHVLALPISICALIIARRKKISDIKMAVYYLKIPFYYGLVGIAILILSSYIY